MNQSISMIHIKVQYDAFNRTFTLVDKEFGVLLEDYGLYEFVIPFTGDELNEVVEFTEAVETQLAHA